MFKAGQNGKIRYGTSVWFVFFFGFRFKNMHIKGTNIAERRVLLWMFLATNKFPN